MTELIWDGKYKDGKKVSPVRIALPFQTIETVNESAQERQKSLDFFSNGQPSEWRNRLIWGDKKYVLPSLLPEFAGKVNLIYIDPPFNVGADFSFKTTIPDNPDTDEDETTEFVKQPSIIEQKAYRDTWGKGLNSYLQWFYETVIFLRELLAEGGTIFIHLDWHIGHYAKVVLDEVFGYENFQNEIIWHYYNIAPSSKKLFARNHDVIFWYAKQNKNQTFNLEKLRTPYEPGSAYANKGWSKTSIYKPNPEGKLMDDVWRIPTINNMAKERVGYDTQKPEVLLNRIIEGCSNENDLVLDCFVGSGTTTVVSEKLNRRWISCDLGRFAIHTTRKRLLGIKDVNPFIIQNLGKYERQQWVKVEFDDNQTKANQEKNYHKFILELYLAQPIFGYNWIHGAKSGRMVHIGSVDTPISIGDVKAIIQEFWKIVGKDEKVQTNGIDILGWEFAFDLNETAKQFAAANKVDLKFKKIPREVLEKRAVEQGDIQFFELASLDIKVKKEKKKVTLTLNNFNIPQDDIPEEARGSISHWSQFIDYWAVDWNYRDDTFHNEWQTYRTKILPTIDLIVSNTYEEKGQFTVVVKVIDILGNDTTKAINIEVK